LQCGNCGMGLVPVRYPTRVAAITTLLPLVILLPLIASGAGQAGAPRAVDSSRTEAKATPNPERQSPPSLAGFEIDGRAVSGRFDHYSVGVAGRAITVLTQAASGQSPLRLAIRLIGADLRRPTPGPTAYRATYITAAQPDGRSTTVHSSVRYRDVYPGIDLVLRVDQGELEYEFVLDPHADPSLIRLTVTGSVSVRRAGDDLVLATASQELRQVAPQLFQRSPSGPQHVDGAIRLRGEHATFSVGEYDRGQALVIDPRVSYSTYLGGDESESPGPVGVDASGRAYVAGKAWGAEFPTGTAVPAGRRLFVARLSSAGQLEQVTFIGGHGDDRTTDLDVAADGSVVLAGSTDSADFPVLNAFQSELGKIYDSGFLLRLMPGGSSMAFSTYLGGSNGSDAALSVALGPSGDIYISGSAGSTDFPLVQPWSTNIFTDGYLGRFTPSGQPVYLTRFMVPGRVAVDSSGAAYVAGTTERSDLTVKNAFQPAPRPPSGVGDKHEGFLGKLSANGATLAFATYLGGSDADVVRDVVVDGSGRAVVVGFTRSPDFPLLAPLQDDLRGATDTFITRFESSGSALSYSTLYGGSGSDEPIAAAFDSQGRLEVAGATWSWDLPITNALQTSYSGGNSGALGGDVYWLRLNPDATALDLSTYLGGEDTDWPSGLATAAPDRTVIVGGTTSSFFPTARPYQPTRQESFSSDMFVISIGSAPGTTYPLTVTRTGTAHGTVRSTPAGISCGSDCTEVFGHGTFVNLTWSTPDGVKFSGWSSPETYDPCGGVWDCAFPMDASTTITARFDEAIPPIAPTITISPDVLWQTGTSFTVAWSATDVGSGVATYDVAYRGNPFPIPWKTGTTATSGTLSSAMLGYNYCFNARARDKVDNVSDYGFYQCTVIPADDTAIPADGSWTRRSGRTGYFLGTSTETSTAGATLTTEPVGGYRLALLVTKCPTCGRIRVLWRSNTSGSFVALTDVDLYATTTRLKQVVQVASWDTLNVGQLRIVVLTSGKPVIIDGYSRQYLREADLNR
jgi:hypothetical protein